MKTVHDWGFISKEQAKDQGLVKPKLQDNKIFHALTSAYENNQQQEIYGATENIMRREKELCELALADLKRLSEGKGETDATIKLVMDHYQTRLHVAREKEEKINQLSEDSRKMAEEYKKKTQELADVKRNLMDSQGKLRELAKTTERLLKREEELRFIESNLRTELDKNKRNIINGLYEIVADLPEAGIPDMRQVVSEVAQAAAEPRPEPPVPDPAAAGGTSVPANFFNVDNAEAGTPTFQEPAGARPFHPAHFRPASDSPFGGGESRIEPPVPSEMAWTRDVTQAPVSPVPQGVADEQPASLFQSEPVAAPQMQMSPRAAAPVPVAHLPHSPVVLKPGDMLEKAARLKMFEPGKTLCAKSMVKTAEGEVISEYFYAPSQQKDSRHYIFNSLFAMSSLLTLKAKDEVQFQDRLEMIFTDLLSRLEHGRNIHLESFLGEDLNLDILDRTLGMPRSERGVYFDTLAAKVLNRIESIGPSRASLIDQQFKVLPKTVFPPGKGISA